MYELSGQLGIACEENPLVMTAISLESPQSAEMTSVHAHELRTRDGLSDFQRLVLGCIDEFFIKSIGF